MTKTMVIENDTPYWVDDQHVYEALTFEECGQAIRQLRGNLSLSEEGLANYALEVERLRSALRGIMLDESPPDRSVSVWLRERACEALGKQPNAHEPFVQLPYNAAAPLHDRLHVHAMNASANHIAEDLEEASWKLQQLSAPSAADHLVAAPSNEGAGSATVGADLARQREARACYNGIPERKGSK